MLSATAWGMPLAVQPAMPVSYTHLDVYKRQDQIQFGKDYEIE